MPRKRKEMDCEDEIPFEDPKEIKRDMCRFRCKRCAYEEDVPGYVVEEFIWWEDMDEEYAKTKDSRMSTMICPKCEGALVFKKETVD